MTVVGIVGGGQLARMLLAPAARLALPVALLARPGDPAACFCDTVVPGAPDAQGLRRLAERCDVVTVEHEQVDLEALAALERAGHLVRPSSAALRVATDKVGQRRRLGEHGVPLAPWTVASTPVEVETFATAHGWPLVLKPPRGGYDGRGVFEVDDPAGAARVLARVGGPVLVEPRLPLGSTEVRAPSAMVNIIGGEDDPRGRLAAALTSPDIAVHLYGKEARPGRKLGHVTVSAADPSVALCRARAAAARLTGGRA